MDEDTRVKYTQLVMNQMRNSGIFGTISITFILTNFLVTRHRRSFRIVTYLLAACYMVIAVLMHILNLKAMPDNVRSALKSWLALGWLVTFVNIVTLLVFIGGGDSFFAKKDKGIDGSGRNGA